MKRIEDGNQSLENQVKPLQEGAIFYIKDDIVYEVHKVTRTNRRRLMRRFVPFESLFGYDDIFTDCAKASGNIKEGGEVVFAVKLGNQPQDVGAMTYMPRDITVGKQEKKLLLVGARAVKEDMQQKGIGTELGKIGLIRHTPDALVGITRTWRIPRANEKTGFLRKNKSMPLEEPLSPEAQQDLSVLMDARPGVLFSQFKRKYVDLTTGVCSEIYPPGENERFKPPLNNPRAIEIDKNLRRTGANPENGDGVMYYEPADKEAIETAKPGYIALDSTPEELRGSRRFVLTQVYPVKDLPGVS